MDKNNNNEYSNRFFDNSVLLDSESVVRKALRFNQDATSRPVINLEHETLLKEPERFDLISYSNPAAISNLLRLKIIKIRNKPTDFPRTPDTLRYKIELFSDAASIWLESLRDNEILYSVKYVNTKVYVNGVLLHKTVFGGDMDSLLLQLFEKPGSYTRLLLKESNMVLNRDNFKVIQDLGFFEALKYMFFPLVTKDSFVFRDKVTRREVLDEHIPLICKL